MSLTCQYCETGGSDLGFCFCDADCGSTVCEGDEEGEEAEV